MILMASLPDQRDLTKEKCRRSHLPDARSPQGSWVDGTAPISLSLTGSTGTEIHSCRLIFQARGASSVPSVESPHLHAPLTLLHTHRPPPRIPAWGPYLGVYRMPHALTLSRLRRARLTQRYPSHPRPLAPQPLAP